MGAVGTTITDLGTLLVHSSHQPRSGKYLNAALSEGSVPDLSTRQHPPLEIANQGSMLFPCADALPLASVSRSKWSALRQKETLGPFVLVELSPPRRHW